MAAIADDHAWWLKPLADIEAELAATAGGLAKTEANARLARYGPNLFRDHRQQPVLLQFLSRFKNPLVIILLVASAISAFTGEAANFVIISSIILLEQDRSCTRSCWKPMKCCSRRRCRSRR